MLKIGYFVHNLNDPSVERRCSMLTRGGALLAVAGFTRDPQLRPDIAMRSPLVVGHTSDANFIGRITGAVKVAMFSKELRHHFRDCDVIMARNLEQLAIARVIARGRPIVYECLDIHRLLVGRSLPAKVVRAAEAALLPHVRLLITSSPAFLREHFSRRPLSAATLLVENKLLMDGSARFAQPSPLGPPWRIGWFGMLRCHRTLDFLTELAAKADGQIEVVISGKPSPVELPDFEARVAASPGLTYTGPYRYEDLADLYGAVHFAWTIDWFEEGLNSSWLLPNRIYEAIAHRTIPIALAGVEAGHWLREQRAGLLVQTPDDARAALLAMDADQYDMLITPVSQMDSRRVVADDRDCREMVAAIGGVAQ